MRPYVLTMSMRQFLKRGSDSSESESGSSSGSESDSGSSSSSGPDDDSAPRSIVTGRKIRMKIKQTKDEQIQAQNRSKLLQFLNDMHDD